jgi:hypothetical protein
MFHTLLFGSKDASESFLVNPPSQLTLHSNTFVLVGNTLDTVTPVAVFGPKFFTVT